MKSVNIHSYSPESDDDIKWNDGQKATTLRACPSTFCWCENESKKMACIIIKIVSTLFMHEFSIFLSSPSCALCNTLTFPYGLCNVWAMIKTKLCVHAMRWKKKNERRKTQQS